MKKSLPADEKVVIFGEEYEISPNEDTVVNIEDLSDNLAKQPGLLAYYGDLKVKAQKQVNDNRALLELFMAQERNKIREATSGKRLYKDDMNDLIYVKEEYRFLEECLRESEYTLEKVSAIYSAVKDKGMTLNSMASMYKAEMFVNDKIMEENFRERRKKLYNKA